MLNEITRNEAKIINLNSSKDKVSEIDCNKESVRLMSTALLLRTKHYGSLDATQLNDDDASNMKLHTCPYNRQTSSSCSKCCVLKKRAFVGLCVSCG